MNLGTANIPNAAATASAVSAVIPAQSAISLLQASGLPSNTVSQAIAQINADPSQATSVLQQTMPWEFTKSYAPGSSAKNGQNMQSQSPALPPDVNSFFNQGQSVQQGLSNYISAVSSGMQKNAFAAGTAGAGKKGVPNAPPQAAAAVPALPDLSQFYSSAQLYPTGPTAFTSPIVAAPSVPIGSFSAPGVPQTGVNQMFVTS